MGRFYFQSFNFVFVPIIRCEFLFVAFTDVQILTNQ